LGKQAHLCNAQRTHKANYVDPAGIGGRNVKLPGEILTNAVRRGGAKEGSQQRS